MTQHLNEIANLAERTQDYNSDAAKGLMRIFYNGMAPQDMPPVVRPKWDDLQDDVKALFQPYYSTQNSLNAAFIMAFNPAVLQLALKFHPDIANVDWENSTFEWVKANWLQPLSNILEHKYRAAYYLMTWDQPYEHICTLPKREYARTVLAAEGIGNTAMRKTAFDEEQLRVWAGYAKPSVVKDGNVLHLKR